MEEKTIEVVAAQADAATHATPLLVLGAFETQGASDLTGPLAAVDGALGGQIGRVIGREDFVGRDGQTLLLYPREGETAAERVLVIGLGRRETFDGERVRRVAATAVKQGLRLGVERLSLALPESPDAERLTPAGAGQAAAEGVILGGYTFDEMRSETPSDRKPRRLSRVEILLSEAELARSVEGGVRVGRIMADAENLARRLGNLPGNVATPTYLAHTARELAARHGMKVEILGRADLERERMGALLAVSQGSDQEPFLIVLEHRKGPEGGKPLVLVGKGLTFDAGGISIKPALGMEDMKFDMCGGAAVLAAMSAIAAFDLPIDVVGLVPTSENLLSGSAMKPGDIVRSHLGKTIEVVNTDAEGRLILADALSYARRFEPAAIVDTATLTGAVVIALGEHATAGLSNDESLLAEVRAAGDRVHERVWPLPMFDEYREQLKSDYADLKNTGGRPAGTITGAWFLREFVGDTPWVHLDIAGTADGDGKVPYRVKGSTGVPTRLLVEWARGRAG